VTAVRAADARATGEDLASPFLDHDTFRELQVQLADRELTLFTRPGVFSWDALDEATAILADAMRIGAGESVLDLGCGAGALGTLAALQSRGGSVVMVDADAEAVRCATRTAERAGAENVEVLASDVGGAVLDRRFDAVVTNPPFHIGKSTDLDVPRQFIEDAWATLRDAGRLYLVANRTLPYERMIAERFGEVRTLHDGARFKVLGAFR
jgi:16S rRNA (guanine1207-N2)-methyltransferase